MAGLHDNVTFGEAWQRALVRFADRPLLAVPAGPTRGYLPSGEEITFREAGARIERIAETYAGRGYGLGHRVATLIENRPDYLLLKLALNMLGVGVVPINPDYRLPEIVYLLEHSEPDLVIALPERARDIADTIGQSGISPPLQLWAGPPDAPPVPPAARRRADSGAITPESEASILYTSGTTGRPKGCILSHGYEIASGAWYAECGGAAAFRPEGERIYNPLPLYHVNAAVVSFLAALHSGSCQIQSDRFHPKRWWSEIRETRASIVHYLGVIVSMLLAEPPSDADRAHGVRLGIGAGVEPGLHDRFEARFGFPLVEIWGMTEMVRLLMDNGEHRQVGTRAFGRAVPGIEVEVVDDAGHPVPAGCHGEMVIRHSAASPRRGFFSGYLKDEAATAAAWRGGWFHTGDVIWRGSDGMLHFADRKKNIIRRSGENIAAAEVEAVLLTHPRVAQAAVLAVKDEVREEEVLACVVLRPGATTGTEAADIVRHCAEQLAYYKAPGWVWLADSLPTTGTQKIQKHAIFPPGTDPRTLPGMIDLRAGKRRDRAG